MKHVAHRSMVLSTRACFPCILMVLALFLSCVPFVASANETETRFSGATGGIVRFPNDLQTDNDNNLFGEAWGKIAYQLAKGKRSETSFFVLGNLVSDTEGFAYNNTAKIGIGISHFVQVTDALNLTFSARHDWFMERETDVRQAGIRLAVDYYYYRRWEPEAGDKFLGLDVLDIVLKSYGSVAYPGSLEKKDNNVVVTFGGELSANLALPGTKWMLTPFADLDFSWDHYGKNYNNKIIPGVGIKVRYPLRHGEIFTGVRLTADARWVDETLSVGPGIFLGWYKGF